MRAGQQVWQTREQCCQRGAVVPLPGPLSRSRYAPTLQRVVTTYQHRPSTGRLSAGSAPPREIVQAAPLAPAAPSLVPPAAPVLKLPIKWAGNLEVCQDRPALGGGAFAEVYRVAETSSRQQYAVKVMHRPNFVVRGIERQIDNEIRAMRSAVADGGTGNIVVLEDVAEEGDYVFLLLELCTGGDLLRRLAQEPAARFDEATGAAYAHQLLLGLRCIHAFGVMHRDIKLDNLLCTGEGGGVLKVADFGWCTDISEAPTALAGTFHYMAPEVLRNTPQTEAVDVWSAGATLYQMMVGAPLVQIYLGPNATNLSERDPAEATRVKQAWILHDLESSCPLRPEARPPHVSPSCWDFLRQLLMPEIADRATVREALRHRWLKTHAPAAQSPAREAPQSPLREQWTPGREISAVSQSGGGSEISEPISNVPTPLKPRSWDSSRNMAYSPPVGTPSETQSPSPAQRVQSPSRVSPLRSRCPRQPRSPTQGQPSRISGPSCSPPRTSAPPSTPAFIGGGARSCPTSLPRQSPASLFSTSPCAEPPPTPTTGCTSASPDNSLGLSSLQAETASQSSVREALVDRSCQGLMTTRPTVDDPLNQTMNPTSSRHHDPARDILLVTAPARCINNRGRRSVSPLRSLDEVPSKAYVRPCGLSTTPNENAPPSNALTSRSVKHLEFNGGTVGNAAAGARKYLEGKADPLSQTQAFVRVPPMLRQSRVSAAGPGVQPQQRAAVPLQPLPPRTYLVTHQAARAAPLALRAYAHQGYPPRPVWARQGGR